MKWKIAIIICAATFGIYGAIFARYGATKDRQGMPRGVAGQ